jgi:endo-1,4-beta-xylanase
MDMFSFKPAQLKARALFAGALLLCLASHSNAQTITHSQTGTQNGFYYQLYLAGGSASMTLGTAGNYAVSWSGVGDLVAGKGWNPGSASRVMNYNCGAYSNSGGGSQGAYGWTTSPLVEYYVQENGTSTAGTQVGQVSSDGGSYTVWHHQQVNQPSIVGTTTFWQNIDARNGSRGIGKNVSITLANHFNFWNSHGMTTGSQNLQILYVESFGGSGYCNQTVW